MSIINVEATVATGLEEVAAQEAAEHFTDATVVASRGRIFLGIQLACLEKVFQLRCVDHVYAVLYRREKCSFSDDKNECFDLIGQSLAKADWIAGLSAWEAAFKRSLPEHVSPAQLANQFCQFLNCNPSTDQSPNSADQPRPISDSFPQTDQSAQGDDASASLGQNKPQPIIDLQQLADQLALSTDTPPLADQSALSNDSPPSADQSALSSTLPPSADQSALSSTLAPSADQSALSSTLPPSADQSALSSTLPPSADQSALSSTLPPSADQSALSSTLPPSADQSALSSTLPPPTGQSALSSDSLLPMDQSAHSSDSPTFRVTCYRAGSGHAFQSPEVAVYLGAIVADALGWKVKLKEQDIELVINILFDTIWLAIPLTRQSLHRRNIIQFGVTTLRPTIAYGLLRFAEIGPQDVICDPLCGSGSIPLEACQAWPEATIFAGDIFAEAVEKTRQNYDALPAHKRANLSPLHCVVWDATTFPLRNHCVDRIVTDVPFGKRLGSRFKNRSLYPQLLAEFARICRPNAKAVLLTQDRRGMIQALGGAKKLWKGHRNISLNVGGLKAAAFIITRVTGE